MSDPERLIDQAGNIEARLLSSALDEPLPAGLLDRTLQAVAVAQGAAAAASASAQAGTSTANGVAFQGGAVASAKVAGGGILGAIGIGALAGVITIGAYEITTASRRDTAPITAPVIAPSASALPEVPSLAAPRPPEAPPEVAPAASAVSTGVVPAPAPRPAASSLLVEIALLDEARAALRGGDAARALSLLDRYAREIPRGQLSREAAMLRVEATAAVDAGRTIP
ncbi:Hypothetical protein A7982_00592 [Minicystis rosea]|nr:Hypothetical protein A7982_00592 [Minicystis rosea]